MRKQRRTKRLLKNIFILATVSVAGATAITTCAGLLSLRLTWREIACTAPIFLISSAYLICFFLANGLLTDSDRVLLPRDF